MAALTVVSNGEYSRAGVAQVAPAPAVRAGALQEVPAGLREARQAAAAGRLRLCAAPRAVPPAPPAVPAARPRRAVLALPAAVLPARAPVAHHATSTSV